MNDESVVARKSQMHDQCICSLPCQEVAKFQKLQSSADASVKVV